MNRIVSIVGARPNFIKLAALDPELRKNFAHIIIHSGQHYDYDMSQSFFSELKIPEPDFNLRVGSESHAQQTAKILFGCEQKLREIKPSLVIVYGDVNTTLAGSLAAAKLNLPVAHVEAGLRSFDKSMPEEINRIVADHTSSLLFCPSHTALFNLKKENLKKKAFFTGDVMYDIFCKINPDYSVLKLNNLKSKGYYFATIHRQENTNSPSRLEKIFNILNSLDKRVILPLHPRTKKFLSEVDAKVNNIKIIRPVKYSQSLALQKESSVILTDSGGIQKEAYWQKIPCITFRNSTEWPETVATGWNILTDCDQKSVVNYLGKSQTPKSHPNLYGNGKAAEEIFVIMKNFLQ